MKREDFLKGKIKEHGYTLKEFSMEIDMPYTTLLSIVNKSVGGAALDNIIKICNGLNISIEILNPYNTKQNNEPSIYDNIYNKLNKQGKAKADEYIKDLSENPRYTTPQKTLVSPTFDFDTAVDVTDIAMARINTDKD